MESILGSLVIMIIFICCLFSFLLIFYDEMKKNFLDIKFLEFAKNLIFKFNYLTKIFLFWSLFLLVVLIIAISQIEGIGYDEIINKISEIDLNQLILPNSMLLEKHLNIAEINFLLFTGSLIILGVLGRYFEMEEELRELFKNFRKILKEVYKKYLNEFSVNTTDSSGFLFYLFEKRDDILNKKEISRLEKLETSYKLIKTTAKCGCLYAVLGTFFLFLSLEENVSKYDFTVDLIFLLGFIFLVLYHIIKLTRIYEKKHL